MRDMELGGGRGGSVRENLEFVGPRFILRYNDPRVAVFFVLVDKRPCTP